MMRKYAWLGLLLVASTGCGRGWLPGIFRGAPCHGTCGLTGGALPAPIDHGCNSCNAIGASYGSYEGEVVRNYYGGEVLGETIVDGGVVNQGVYGSGVVMGDYYNSPGYPIEGTIVNPSMADIPAAE